MTVNLSMLAGAGAQFFSSNGVPLTGGKLYSYSAGTTTPQATYTTSAGNVAHANPIILDSAGRVPNGGEIWLTDAVSYKFVLKDSSDVTIATYDNIAGNGSGIYDSVFARLAQSDGSSLIGFLQSGTGAVATTEQAKLRETVSVKDFGAVGDNATDDTTAIQLAVNSGAKVVYIPSGTYKVTGVITVPNGVSISGQETGSSTISALSGFTISNDTAVLYWVNASNCTVENITIQGNSATLTGANYGIKFKTGSNNTIRNVVVNNTSLAGIWGEEQNNFNVANVVIYQCGTQAAYIAGNFNAHGLLLSTSTATTMDGIFLDNVTVKQAWRKGFALTSNYATPATVSKVRVTNCLCVDCGISPEYGGDGGGNFFFSSEAPFDDFQFINCHAKNATMAEVGFQVQQITNLIIADCSVQKAKYGIYGAQLTNAVISNNIVKTTRAAGIYVNPLGTASTTPSYNITVIGNQIYDSNTDANGTGIQFNRVTTARISDNTLKNNTPSAGYGIYTDVNSTEVVTFGNSVSGYTTSKSTNLGSSKIDMVSNALPKAYVRFAGATGVINGNSYNVASVARASTGKYTLTFNQAMPSTFYTLSFSKTAATVTGDCFKIVDTSTGTCEFWVYEGGSLVDPTFVNATIHCSI